MTRRLRLSLPALAIAIALAGCSSPAAPTTGTRGQAETKAGAPPGKAPGGGQLPPVPGTVASPGATGPGGVVPAGDLTPGTGTPGATPSLGPNGTVTPPVTGFPPVDLGGLVAVSGQNLVGTVRVPAGIVAAGGLNLVAAGGLNMMAAGGGNLVAAGGGNLVAAGGGNLVAAGGGNVVGNGGAGYRLHALPEELAIANARVRLVDAAGNPARDAENRPLETITDAYGRFSFPTALPAATLVAIVDLAEGFGSVAAVVPAPEGGGARQAELDLVNTLTSRWAVDRIAKSQPDPQASLDRYTDALARATRERTRDALAGSNVPPPTRLTIEGCLAAVDAAKGQSVAMAAQFEICKKAMTVVGQADLGVGRPAIEVSVKSPHTLAVGADGSLYVASWDHVVYRVKPDGTLVKAAGAGTYAPNTSPQGVLATEAKLQRIPHTALDSRGRLAVLEEGGRLTRVEASGKMAELLPGFQPYTWVGGLVAMGERLGVFTGDTRTGEVTLTIVGTSGATSKHVFPADALKLYEYESVAFGADAQGRIYMATSTSVADKVGNTQLIQRIEPDTFAVSTLVDAARDHYEGVSVDPAGNLFLLEAGSRKLTAKKPDGTLVELSPSLPTQLGLFDNRGVVLAADGKAYIGREAQVWQVGGAAAKIVLGTAETGTSEGNVYDLALEEPRGLTFDTDGTLFVADRWKRHVIQIAGQASTLFAGGGTGADGGPAKGATLGNPTKLQRDAAGVTYILEDGGALRQVASGAEPLITTIVAGGLSAAVKDFAAAADGTLTWVEVDHSTPALAARLRRKAPGAEPTEAVDLPDGTAAWSLALAGDGAIFLATGGKLYKWTEGSELAIIEENIRFDVSYGMGLAVDAQGRLVAPHYNTIFRFDPADHAYTPLAGTGSTKFSGDGVENSLQWPSYPTFAPNGDLYFSDTNHKQVKRVLAAEL